MKRPKRHPSVSILLAASAMVLGLACEDEGDNGDEELGCIGAKCDDPLPEDFACQSVADGSGNAPVAGFVEGLEDPIATFVLKRGEECPQNLGQIMDKLREQDAVGCEDAGRTGLTSRIVSERAQLLGEPDSFRVVTARQCEERQEFELLFSLFGINGKTATSLPQNNTEMIGFDEEAGVFNYYTLRGGQWTFHGNSVDMIRPGSTAECAACHTGGGLIMKELNAPWVHWEGDIVTPGAAELVDRIEDLGSKRDGINMESVVRQGNETWNGTRIAVLSDESRTDVHGGSLKELLRPLFCTTEFNLQSVGGPGFGGGPPIQPNGTRIDFLIDPATSAFASPRFAQADYQALIETNNQRIEGIPGARDTIFGFTFPERSHADMNYVEQLRDAGIVDPELIMDVLVVDFTRPVFSDARCGLLEHAPSFADLEDPGDGGGGGGGGGVDAGTCCEQQQTAGCSEPTVEACVCERDRFCCETSWDGVCVGEVTSFNCGTCGSDGGGEPKGACCDVHGTAGCADEAVEACVCDKDEFCCNNEWDQICVNLVEGQECGSCTQAQAPSVGLGAEVPIQSAEVTADAIRQAFVAKLEALDPAKGTPEFELLVNLQNDKQESGHKSFVQDYVQACQARAENRDDAAFLSDLLTVAARVRNAARVFGPSPSRKVIEFAETMVFDDLQPSPNAHFDPATCELVE